MKAVRAAAVAALLVLTSCNVIASGGSLKSDGTITSKDGRWRAHMQPDGNFCVIGPGEVPAWCTNTASPGATVTMQGDGNLVLSSQAGSPLWDAKTAGNPGATAEMQDDGNLVVYTPDHRPLWSRIGGRTGNAINRAEGGSTLRDGNYLITGDSRYKLKMQGDNNLVLLDGNNPVWSTGTGGRSGGTASMQSDGNLVVYDASGNPLWNTETGGNPGAFLVVQGDGNVVVQRGSQPLWSRYTGRINVGGVRGDDYPYKGATSGVDPWGFYKGQCTSFVAWRMNNANGVAFTNLMGGGRWSNANNWDNNAAALGYAVNNTPKPGAIAQTDTGDSGHVAWVAQVNSDGTVVIEEYNRYGDSKYTTRTVNPSAFRYIHVRDLG